MKKQYQRLHVQRMVQGNFDNENEEPDKAHDTDRAESAAPPLRANDIRRAIAHPHATRPETFTAMQKTYGNQAVQRLIASSRATSTPSGQNPAQSIQRVIDDRVQIVMNENAGGVATNRYITRYMDLIPASEQQKLMHLWSKVGKNLTKDPKVDNLLRLLRYCLLVEATRHGIDSAFTMKKRAEKQCTNAVGIWNSKKLFAFINPLSTDIQEGEDIEANATFEREERLRGLIEQAQTRKYNQTKGALNQIVPGLDI